jgi:hypothetical protein
MSTHILIEKSNLPLMPPAAFSLNRRHGACRVPLYRLDLITGAVGFDHLVTSLDRSSLFDN